MKLRFDSKTRSRWISLSVVICGYILISVLQAAGSLNRMLVSLLVPMTCYIIAAIGLNLNVGLSGELNLGQAGFMAVGGFSAAVVSGMLGDMSAPLRLVICVLVGSVLAGIIGFLISIPVLKLEGDYLAIVTLAFGQIIVSLVNNLYVGVDKSGLHFAFVNNTLKLDDTGKILISGPMGAASINRASTFLAGTILILIALTLVYNLMYSKSGRAIMACRDNRIAAETVGISVSRTKTIAFVLSSALGGAAGALYMLNYTSVAASKFDYNNSIMILVYVVLGGLGNMTGTIVSTAVLVVLPEVLRFLSEYRMLIYSLVLIGIMLVTNHEKLKTIFAKVFKRKVVSL